MEDIHEVSPPGFEGTVKAMKKHKEIDNPYALAWHMKNKGYKSHKKKDGTNKMKNESLQNQIDSLRQNIQDKEEQERRLEEKQRRESEKQERKERIAADMARRAERAADANLSNIQKSQNMVGREASTSRDTAKDSLTRRADAARERRMAKMKREGYISFSNFISEAEKELPKCPEGYKYNRDTKRCEPKKDSDDVRGKMNKSGGSSTGFTGKVIGSHGQNGAPPAYGEKSSGKGLYMSRDGDMGTSGWHDQFSGGLGSNPMGTA